MDTIAEIAGGAIIPLLVLWMIQHTVVGNIPLIRLIRWPLELWLGFYCILLLSGLFSFGAPLFVLLLFFYPKIASHSLIKLSTNWIMHSIRLMIYISISLVISTISVPFLAAGVLPPLFSEFLAEAPSAETPSLITWIAFSISVISILVIWWISLIFLCYKTLGIFFREIREQYGEIQSKKAQPGDFLICNFTGNKPPEMIKVRPVVVISPARRDGSGTCIVVPLSTTPPSRVQPYHHRMDPLSRPEGYREKEVWAKCDMVAHVSLKRLMRPREHRMTAGDAYQVTEEDLNAIRKGVAYAIGIDGQASIPGLTQQAKL